MSSFKTLPEADPWGLACRRLAPCEQRGWSWWGWRSAWISFQDPSASPYWTQQKQVAWIRNSTGVWHRERFIPETTWPSLLQPLLLWYFEKELPLAACPHHQLLAVVWGLRDGQITAICGNKSVNEVEKDCCGSNYSFLSSEPLCLNKLWNLLAVGLEEVWQMRSLQFTKQKHLYQEGNLPTWAGSEF